MLHSRGLFPYGSGGAPWTTALTTNVTASPAEGNSVVRGHAVGGLGAPETVVHATFLQWPPALCFAPPTPTHLQVVHQHGMAPLYATVLAPAHPSPGPGILNPSAANYFCASSTPAAPNEAVTLPPPVEPLQPQTQEQEMDLSSILRYAFEPTILSDEASSSLSEQLSLPSTDGSMHGSSTCSVASSRKKLLFELSDHYEEQMSSKNGNKASSVKTESPPKLEASVKKPGKAIEVLVTRPARISDKKGCFGTVLNLHANFYLIPDVAKMPIFKYSICITPNIEGADALQGVVHGCGQALGNFILHRDFIYCTKFFTGNASKLFSQFKGKAYMVSLLEGKPVDSQERVLVVGKLVKKLLKAQHMFQAGKVFFGKDDCYEVHSGIERLCGWSVKPGFLPVVLNCESGILLNVDIVHMIVRPETALELLQHIQSRSKNADPVFKEAIVGQYVVTKYNGRIYKVTDVAFKFSPVTEFDYRDDGPTTFIRYYEKKYGVTITNAKQPLLVSQILTEGKEGTKVHLVPELCNLTGFTAEQRRDFFLTRTIHDEITTSPHKHQLKIGQFLKYLSDPKDEKTQKLMQEWRLRLSSEMVSFTGRHLPAELAKVRTSGRNPSTVKNLFDWSEEWKSYKMLHCVPVTKWAVLVPSTMVKQVERFINVLQSCSAMLGITLAKPFIIQVDSEDVNCYLRELKKLFGREKPQIIFCVLSCSREDKYRAIKRLCSVEFGVASQVLTRKSLDMKYDLPIAKRLAVQVNCKVGGTPWSVEVPLRLGMVLGVDVGPDSRTRGVSYCSVVASFDKNYSRFYSATFEFASDDRQQLIDLLCEHVAKALQHFRAQHKSLPSVILFYRDGVSEHALRHVATKELPLLQKWLTEIYKGDSWRLSFVVVSKHCNTRIYGSGNSNPPTGTVVDTCITRPERYDFLLLSGQNQRKAASFTHYNVLFDNTVLSPDRLQRLTYKMTHLYFNIKGTVRVPAPLRYASRLVSVVGNTLHQPPHVNLSNVLHFL